MTSLIMPSILPLLPVLLSQLYLYTGTLAVYQLVTSILWMETGTKLDFGRMMEKRLLQNKLIGTD